MRQNIVLIETAENMGTGILYPCEYDKKDYGTDSYIIFTNQHVIEDIVLSNDENENYSDRVGLKLFDNKGTQIDDDKIKEVLIYNNNNITNIYSDIAALLVILDNRCILNLETKVYTDLLENRETVYMEGYPGVMLEDEVSQKVQLEGKIKEIFPTNPHVGVYQISDQYHWYNNYKDKDLLEGFSGSPVYKLTDSQYYLLGMNQSVSNIDDGENPFKLVYYIKFEYVLEYLREIGIVSIYCRKIKFRFSLRYMFSMLQLIYSISNF